MMEQNVSTTTGKRLTVAQYDTEDRKDLKIHS